MGDRTLLSERKMRRALYGITASMWALSLGVAIHAAVTGSLMSRTLVLFTLAITSSVTTATLFAVFVAPLEKVYRHGYEAGQHARQEFASVRRVAIGQRAQVVPFRGRNN